MTGTTIKSCEIARAEKSCWIKFHTTSTSSIANKFENLVKFVIPMEISKSSQSWETQDAQSQPSKHAL